jgi:MFS family permease
MYQVESSGYLFRLRRKRRPGVPPRKRVSRTVVLLGLTSLFTDLSSEMVATILPLYLVYSLGLTPLQFGIVDGLYQGAAALVRVASGFVGDRWRRHKEVAAVGYGLSAVTKLGFPLVGAAWTALGALVLVDRTGKGIRTAPRDALISLNSPREGLGEAFGVHRALDTVGAMLGPLAAFVLLALAPGSFDSIFVVSFCFALIGVSILVLFVDGRPAPLEPEELAERASLRSAAGLLRQPRFRTLVILAGALALATISDGFVYLRLQQEMDFDETLLPLLYVATALAYMLLAVPFGRLADKIGRGRMFLAGYAMLLLIYASLLLPALGTPQLVLTLLLFGAYYAATDGVLMALVSAFVPANLRGSGLAILVTATSVGRLFASVLFGLLWSSAGADTAVVVFAVALSAAVGIAAAVLMRGTETAVAT